MGERGAQNYIKHVFGAMVDEWLNSYDTNLVLDIFSMAIARASDPKARADTTGENTSYQRKNGAIIAPDEATADMIAKGVSETAENKTQASEQTGGNSDYIASIYENMVKARNEK